MNSPTEILKLIKILSPQTLPNLAYLSREDLSLTNVRAGFGRTFPLLSDGNHFFQLGAPEATTTAMRAFLGESKT